MRRLLRDARTTIEKPIEIGRLQRFAMENFLCERRWKLPAQSPRSGHERVACIGAGPASLACAAELRQQGFQVTVVDRRPLPGGLNTYGVAEYKLRAADSLREIEMIRGLGVEFRTAEIVDAVELESWSANSIRSFWAWGWERCIGWTFREATHPRRRSMRWSSLPAYKTASR